jgi:hypothetical protein
MHKTRDLEFFSNHRRLSLSLRVFAVENASFSFEQAKCPIIGMIPNKAFNGVSGASFHKISLSNLTGKYALLLVCITQYCIMVQNKRLGIFVGGPKRADGW